MERLSRHHVFSSSKNQIGSSRREATILFTDIENSTRYWGNRGDVQGRLMVDRHNRLLFPIVRHFHGKVIKTIGDSIMAMFKRPKDAISAAIAMQQALARARREDSSFRIRIRIGIHTGAAIVEHNDVFGDMVNVAARLEDRGEGNEILLSGKCARQIDRTKFALSRREGFVPKGKRDKIAVYACDWQGHDDLLGGINKRELLPLAGMQKLEVSLYAVASIIWLYLIHLSYTRYLLADHESLALIFLNPQQWLGQHPLLASLIGLVFIAAFVIAMKINSIPVFGFKALKGVALGGLLGVASHHLLLALPDGIIHRLHDTLYASDHLFVEVQADTATVRESPSPQAEALSQQGKGTLLLLADVRKVGHIVWNKVLVGERSYGWVERIIPASLGIPQTRATYAEKFYFTYADLYALAIAMVGFVWGVISFRVKPV